MITAYLQFGSRTNPPMQTIKADQLVITDAPINRSISGYGSKLPTQYKIKHGSVWRRVYAICWSNVSTLYVMIKGDRVIVNIYED